MSSIIDILGQRICRGKNKNDGRKENICLHRTFSVFSVARLAQMNSVPAYRPSTDRRATLRRRFLEKNAPPGTHIGNHEVRRINWLERRFIIEGGIQVESFEGHVLRLKMATRVLFGDRPPGRIAAIVILIPARQNGNMVRHNGRIHALLQADFPTRRFIRLPISCRKPDFYRSQQSVYPNQTPLKSHIP